MSPVDLSHSPLSLRLRDGLERIAAVIRADQWSSAHALGLTPTQVNILALLAGRNDAVRVKDIAHHLGVSAPTATDSIAALERKGLVAKAGIAGDARAVAIVIQPEGRAMLQAVGLAASASGAALAALPEADQTRLLGLLVTLIRHLQQAGALPAQRLCVTCRHFRPNVYPDAENPHHCAFVNAAFGNRDLRLDCGEHETADPALQAATWMAFTTGTASLQTPPAP
ncbi:MAG: MarR family transcriptional regulator [Beijerinckiaceae bacterium]|jgi:DNA-binding MarR family transcriptional regulator|nr:MarR family transcriptional regulator [Beijerinckiaceae bacterium]